jgi:hypothetical protein
MEQYILDEKGTPVHEPDITKWGQWFSKADRHVGNETIGNSQISTVFLGLDHAFGGGVPVLWETMVFGGKLDQVQDRCSGSREQAEAMHARMVERVTTIHNKLSLAGGQEAPCLDQINSAVS